MVDASTFGELKDNSSNKKVITKKWCNGKKESGTGKINIEGHFIWLAIEIAQALRKLLR